MLKQKILWKLSRLWLGCRKTGFWASFWTDVQGSCAFEAHVRIYAGSTVWDSTLGRHTYIAGARVVNADIGAFCSIGSGALVGGLGRHPTHMLSSHPIFYSTRGQSGASFVELNFFDEFARCSVGNDVWIGANAIILDGVSIGDGAIIAAGAVVNSDVEPYSIVGGVPARLIRKRFDDQTIAEVLSLAWWNWSDEKLKTFAPLMRAADVRGLRLAGREEAE